MYIPFAPRILIFSFFKQLWLLAKKKKKVCRMQVRSKRCNSVFRELSNEKLKYEKFLMANGVGERPNSVCYMEEMNPLKSMILKGKL